MKNYCFDERIEREVLCNYLSRAVTASGMYDSDTMDDDLRMILNIGAKFLGRAAWVWDVEMGDDIHFKKAKEFAEQVHTIDGDIILQACIFEAVFHEMEQFNVPFWVFEAFDLPIVERNFKFDDMIFDGGGKDYHWDGGAIPDINRLETRMWFYYRAVSYINAGYEAIHMGQVHLYAADDTGYQLTYDLFGKIRDYARSHARRHIVILDAHTHGVNVHGKLLFDFHSIPFSRKPLLEVTGEKLVFVNEGFSEGGISPSGWDCETLPVLMEFDNWGGKEFKEEDQIPYEKRAFMQWWGYDQITWFANQDEASRNMYLEYAYRWVVINDINAYCQMPLMRTLGNCHMEIKLDDSDESKWSNHYKANKPSEACPLGFGQEETIKRLWRIERDGLAELANPELRVKGYFGATEDYHAKTGIKLPSRVIVYGNFQHYIGATNYDSNSEITRMYHLGNGIYTYSCILPFAGEYDIAVAPYGTLSQIYSVDAYPRSGSGCSKIKLMLEKDNSIVRISFDLVGRKVSVEIF